MVARAKEVERRAGRERLDEDKLPISLDDRALAEFKELARRGILGDREISIASVIQFETDDDARTAELVITTHHATGAALEGWGVQAQLGVAGSVFGNDHLALYIEHQSITRSGTSPLTEIGLRYRWLY